MQLVMLGGELGEKYGAQHEYYNLRTPADAIKLLCVNYPEFQRDLVTAHERGVGYKVIKGLPMEDYDEMNLPFGSRPLMLVPVITGSGGSTGQILLGVGLVAASFLLPGSGLFGASAFGVFGGPIAAAGTLTTVGTALSAVGAGLILSGTASLISPQPELPKFNRTGSGTKARGTGPQGVTRGASGEQSYVFTGPSNTVGTGATIPVIYGRVITGGHLISSNLRVVDDSDPHLSSIGSFTRSNVTINGEKMTREFRELGGVDSRKVNDDDVASGAEIKLLLKTFGPGLEKQVDDEDSSLEFELPKSSSLEYKKNNKDKLKRIDVLIGIPEGLFNYTLGENSTAFAGFISYTIELIFAGGGSKAVAASVGATIQGMFNKGKKPLVYVHRLEVPRGAEQPENVKIRFKVTGAECHDAATIELLEYGYRLVDDD